MKRLFYLLCFITIPVFGQECTESLLHFKKDKTLYFLTQSLIGQNKQTEFVEKGLLISQDFSTLYAQYQTQKSKASLNQMCAILDQMIDLANDLLAGGSGLTHQKPWKNHTPEDLFRLEEKMTQNCITSANLEETLFQKAFEGEDPVSLIENRYEALAQCFKEPHLESTSFDQSGLDDLEKATLD